MKLSEFVQRVRKMRDLQKEYFATRDRSLIGQAQAAERRVDTALSDLWIGLRNSGHEIEVEVDGRFKFIPRPKTEGGE